MILDLADSMSRSASISKSCTSPLKKLAILHIPILLSFIVMGGHFVPSHVLIHCYGRPFCTLSSYHSFIAMGGRFVPTHAITPMRPNMPPSLSPRVMGGRIVLPSHAISDPPPGNSRFPFRGTLRLHDLLGIAWDSPTISWRRFNPC